jgi:hypothetical protein
MYYGTAEGFLAYHTTRGTDVTEWEGGQITPKLLVASEWLDGAFRGQFQGWKAGLSAQMREWPRTGAVDYYGYAVSSATVPFQIEYATYEVALRALKQPDILNKDAAASKYKRVAIEGAISVEYGDQSAAALQAQFPIVGQILSSLLTGGDTSPLSSRVVRV